MLQLVVLQQPQEKSNGVPETINLLSSVDLFQSTEKKKDISYKTNKNQVSLVICTIHSSKNMILYYWKSVQY